MAEPTTTLATLRRAIAKELGMPFAKRYKNGYLTSDSGDTSTLVDSDLTQKDKFWNGAWVYRIASQEVSQVTNFDQRANQLSLEVPITSLNATDYEIHNLWNAYEIHEAINQAIRDSRRVFSETITDETLIVEEDKLAYSLTGLARVPFLIHKVWIEQPSTIKRGTVVSSTLASVTLENSGVTSDVNSDWKISIYYGTGAGQVRDIGSVNGAQLIVNDWVTQPDSTSKYALWNPEDQLYDWYPWPALRYDSMKEFPDLLYFSRRPIDFYGLRIRLEYSAYPLELSAETDTTIIPQSYIVPAAVSKLHGRKIGDTKVDRDLHFAESKRYADMAQAWLIQNAPHRPDNDILSQHSGQFQPDTMNPLNWK